MHRASGKLLISGEYAVLHGALALAIPTKAGQLLSVAGESDFYLHWQAFDHRDQLWLDLKFNELLEPLDSSAEAKLLSTLFKKARALGGKLPSYQKLRSRLEFDRNWGLGSSSSLVALISQLCDCPLMPLYRAAYQGSAYDVWTALLQKPLRYRLSPNDQPQYQFFEVPQTWRDTYFVYLGKKQDSQNEVARVGQRPWSSAEIQAVNALSEEFLKVKSTAELRQALDEHEEMLGNILGRQAVQEVLFSDFDGSVKSLGAWGGDFVWVVGGQAVKRYFANKGYPVCLAFSELISV